MMAVDHNVADDSHARTLAEPSRYHGGPGGADQRGFGLEATLRPRPAA
jgi:hypothetical protein